MILSTNINHIIYYDFAALAIFVLIILFFYLRRLNRTSSSKIFLIFMIVAFVATGLEIICTQMQKYYNSVNMDFLDNHFWISYLLFTLFMFLEYSISFIYFIYVLVYTKSITNLVKKKIFYLIILLPYLLMLTAVFINSFTHFIFKLEIGDNGNLIFEKSNYIFILFAIETYYLIATLFHLIKNFNTFSKTQFFALAAYVITVVIGKIIWLIDPNVLIEMLLIGLSALLIVQNVESPELLLDSRTGLSSARRFNLVTKRIFIYKNYSEVILINIINYSDILNRLGYENFDIYLRNFSETLDTKYKNKELAYNVYYLGDGLYAIVFFNGIGLRELSEAIYNDLSNLKFKNFDFNAKIGVCTLNIPKDFPNYNSFTEFTNNFHDNKISGITIYSDIKNDKEYLIKYNMESILDDAIKYNRFVVYYQPIYDVKNKCFSIAEALSRIDDPTYGIIYPNAFINFAETNGYISTIDLNVIENVMRFMNTDEFKTLNLSRISINLSLADFTTIDFVTKVLDLKKKYNFDPSKILFEITETNSIGDENYFLSKISELREAGFEFMLDDYGVGYSNLERFAKSPINYVKVDRELVKLSKDIMMKDILNTTFNMIHDLDRESVIEGVETQEELDKFMNYHCNYVQGYFFSRPIPELDFIEFLKEHNK